MGFLGEVVLFSESNLQFTTQSCWVWLCWGGFLLDGVFVFQHVPRPVGSLAFGVRGIGMRALLIAYYTEEK